MYGWLKGEVARAVEFLVNRLADWCRQLPSPPPLPPAPPLEESRGEDARATHSHRNVGEHEQRGRRA